MLTKRQVKELEEMFNNISYLTEVSKRMEGVLEYNGNIAKLGALENALDILGYRVKCESRIKNGIEYWHFELFKK